VTRKVTINQGFTLLEVLVALVVISLSLAVLMRIFSGALNNLGAAEAYTQALALAESQLSAAGVETPLLAGESRGEDGQGRSWLITIRPFEEADSSPVAMALPITLYRVEIEVQWQSRLTMTRSLRLTTLKIARKDE